jgi:hypothetical protein
MKENLKENKVIWNIAAILLAGLSLVMGIFLSWGGPRVLGYLLVGLSAIIILRIAVSLFFWIVKKWENI